MDQFIGEFGNYRVILNRRYVDFKTTNIRTGERKIVTWNWLMSSGNFYDQIQAALITNGYELTRGDANYNETNWKNRRWYKNYMFVNVPDPIINPNIKSTPETLPGDKGMTPGLFSEIPNWVMPVAIAIGSYFVVKRFL